MKDIKNYTLDELKTFLKEHDFPRFYATQIFRWVYKKRIEDPTLMTDLSRKARTFVKRKFSFSSLSLLNEVRSKDGTGKFLFTLQDGCIIETVFIPEGKRNTLCVSTQAGCKFGCRFCVSGVGGFCRNLETSEIINQFLAIRDAVAPRRITNIVFMGIGEPLDNFDNLIRSIRILQSPHGGNFGKRRLCVSTCGIIPSMKKLLALDLGIKFSVSLHTADAAKRSRIMPVNKKYPLGEVIQIAKRFSRPQTPVTFEYILIGDFNCTKEDAAQLAKLLKGTHYKLNIIPYNPSEYFPWKMPSQDALEAFTEALTKRRVFFTLRKSRGQDIKAACGQLRAGFKKNES